MRLLMLSLILIFSQLVYGSGGILMPPNLINLPTTNQGFGKLRLFGGFGTNPFFSFDLDSINSKNEINIRSSLNYNLSVAVFDSLDVELGDNTGVKFQWLGSPDSSDEIKSSIVFTSGKASFVKDSSGDSSDVGSQTIGVSIGFKTYRLNMPYFSIGQTSLSGSSIIRGQNYSESGKVLFWSFGYVQPFGEESNHHFIVEIGKSDILWDRDDLRVTKASNHLNFFYFYTFDWWRTLISDHD